HIGVRRVLMCGELRFHDVAALTAELGRLHMLHCPVGALRTNNDVDGCSQGEEYGQSSEIKCPVGRRQQTLFNALAGEEKAERDQQQTCDENDRNYEEDYDADVWIAR